MKSKEPPTPNDVKNEPVLPVGVPMSIIRWLVYSLLFWLLLLAFPLTPWQRVCGALILGWFAGLLNAIKNK